MAGNLNVSENPTLSFHSDNETASVSRQAEDSNPTVCAQDEHNCSVSPRAEEGRPNTPFQTDDDNVILSLQADSKLVGEAQEHTVAMTVHSSTLLTSGSDVTMADNSQEGKLISENMGNPATGTPEVEGELAVATVGSPNVNIQASEKLDDEFLSIGDNDENVAEDNQTDFTNGEGVSMQEDLPWNKESIDNLVTGADSPDGDRRSSLKRSHSACYDNTPSVQVIYSCLTRESKNKLKELLQQWAQWHGEFVGMKEDAERGHLESGDETYFPPLQVGGVSTSSVSFWMDKPSKQARAESDSTPASQDREKEVPLYDRAGTGALISQETEMSLEGGLECVEEGSRCFNCGSYSHSLKECPRPRDNFAISNARKLLAEKRGSANGSRSSRYYQSSRGGKFDDLKPGFLGNETRQLLGIGEHDPPPWLNRMRELGYPPGYLEDQEEEQSGITIFGTNEDAEGNFIGEDGEIVSENKKKTFTAKTMKVHFPGLNAPIPDDADRHLWGSPADKHTHDRPHRLIGRSTHFDGIEDWEAPPGCGRDNYGRNSKMRSPGFEGPLLNKTPPWPPIELGRLGKAPPPPPPPRSPHLSRSGSDSGRRSPKVAYDEPHSLPPLGHYSSSRQSPSHGLRPYHSPSTPNLRYSQRQDSREEDSRRRPWAQAHDAFQPIHRNDRYSPGRRR